MLRVKLQYQSMIRGKQRAFTMVETLIGAAMLLVVAVGVYQGYISIMRIVWSARNKTDAMLVANEQIEIARNIPYSQVGIVSGLPVGVIPREKTLVRNGAQFKVTTSVRNIDDPFDGTIGGTPNDLSPADYKLVEMLVECLTCKASTSERVSTRIAPRGLETNSGNGALFIKVFDASGNPVPQANVVIQYASSSPFTVTETTNNDGTFQLVDAPPGNFAYQVTVSKSGYSASRTYLPGSGGNTNPTIPNATVLTGQVTLITFSIDKLSQLNVRTATAVCGDVGGIRVRIHGEKTIGTNPVIYKYDEIKTTDGTGNIVVDDMEWDSYQFSLVDAGHQLTGSLPLIPVALNPNTQQDATLILDSQNPNFLLVAVKDAVTGLPLSSSTVSVVNGSTQTQITNRGFFNQTDWSGGSGQTLFTDTTKYSSADTGIDTTSDPGTIHLRNSLGTYLASGWLISSVFDTGAIGSSFFTLSWNPIDQATSTGATPIKIQLASGNDPATTTWEYVGPDGTDSTYYTVSGQTISSAHNNHRYIRYKIILSTDDPAATPNVSDVAITFSSQCMPFGQAFFTSLGTGTTTVSVERSGYQTQQEEINITNDWQALLFPLQPQ